MKAILFTDAHIHDTRGAELVKRFLEEKSNVYFLGDMFDTPRDMKTYGSFLESFDFHWIKGNHDYGRNLPYFLDLGNVLLTHGHTILVSWNIEKYLVKYTPTAMRIGLFEPVMWLGRLFRDSIIERAVGTILVNLTRLTRANNGRKPVIMGHLHHYIRAGNIIVLPRFPLYAELKGNRLKLLNYLDEI